MAREECPACGADCEIAPTGESIYAYASRLGIRGADLPPQEHRAICIACRGLGLAEIACDGCDQPVDIATLNEGALDVADVLVHKDCDTNHKYFDVAATEARRSENFFASREMRAWRGA